jgi:hypothetical protein
MRYLLIGLALAPVVLALMHPKLWRKIRLKTPVDAIQSTAGVDRQAQRRKQNET